jgi:excisionase family DNA binding protein
VTEKLPDLVDAKYVAGYLDVTIDTVEKWLREGTLVGTKLGHRWYIPTDRLAELLDPSRRPAQLAPVPTSPNSTGSEGEPATADRHTSQGLPLGPGESSHSPVQSRQHISPPSAAERSQRGPVGSQVSEIPVPGGRRAQGSATLAPVAGGHLEEAG